MFLFGPFYYKICDNAVYCDNCNLLLSNDTTKSSYVCPKCAHELTVRAGQTNLLPSVYAVVYANDNGEIQLIDTLNKKDTAVETARKYSYYSRYKISTAISSVVTVVEIPAVTVDRLKVLKKRSELIEFLSTHKCNSLGGFDCDASNNYTGNMSYKNYCAEYSEPTKYRTLNHYIEELPDTL